MIFEFAKCPECGSLNLDFGDIYWDEDGFEPRIRQDAICNDCGCEYAEFHTTRFDRTRVCIHGDQYGKHSNEDPEEK